MKKLLLIGAATLIVSNPTFAGDYLTNTNQNAAFLRMVARGASIDVDGVYSNPAGLAFLPKDGFHLSLTGQSAFQTREIEATTPLWTLDGNNTTRNYEGTASAPLIPSFQGVYKQGDWAISASFAITGGGGKASFDEGLPMFSALATGLITQASQGQLTPSMYDINTAMDGKQYIYGVQLGLSYKIADWVSVFAGGRMNYFSGGYEGYLFADLKEPYAQALQRDPRLAGIELDCKQTGWGLTPVIGADFKLGKFNIGLKYEFKTNLNIENKTKKMELQNVSDAYLANYKDGVNTPSDIPALFSAAVSYSILPTLRVSAEYHFFDDKNARMAPVTLPDGSTTGKQHTLKHGTHEYLAGIEWDVRKKITLSGGFQKTNYGLSDDFQTDTSFYCDSYSLGFGARVGLNDSWSIDVAYFWTTYSDYTKSTTAYNGIKDMPGIDVYSRTNKVFGLSLNYNF
ncbi:hypothetical protein [uncultured Bacteroides sp.]|uniref:OmpP1/FadL family transporter n=1 Tax=uncultured Bacteroides sp. TaxID=162156 RepID=UPI002632BE28|nr:hypothetical protein [uncultured Bacteroides sp.]